MTESMSGVPAPVAQVGEVVGREPAFGDARELEQQHVPRLLALFPACGGERGRVADRQAGQAGDPFGRQCREYGADRTTPVVADDVGRACPEDVEEPDQVTDHLHHSVARDGAGFVGLTEAAEIGRDGSVAGLAEGGDLVAPDLVAVGPAVEQEDGFAVADVRYLEDCSVDVQAHGELLQWRQRGVAIVARSSARSGPGVGYWGALAPSVRTLATMPGAASASGGVQSIDATDT